MLWTCPVCGKEFKNTNQWHSCARVELEHHLRNKSPQVRTTFEKLLREVHKFGKITVTGVKTAVQVRAASTFISIQLRKNHLLISFQLDRAENGYPVFKTEPISKNRVLHTAVLEGPEDVGKQLVTWLEKSYEMGKE